MTYTLAIHVSVQRLIIQYRLFFVGWLWGTGDPIRRKFDRFSHPYHTHTHPHTHTHLTLIPFWTRICFHLMRDLPPKIIFKKNTSILTKFGLKSVSKIVILYLKHQKVGLSEGAILAYVEFFSSSLPHLESSLISTFLALPPPLNKQIQIPATCFQNHGVYLRNYSIIAILLKLVCTNWNGLFRLNPNMTITL